MCAARWLIAIVIVASVCWRFPLFHVVPLKRATAEKVAAIFNSTQFAEAFWTNKLVAALDNTVKADALAVAIQMDSAAAKKKYSHRVGLSEGYFYFVSGSGKILSVTDDEILLAVTENNTNAEISLQIGLIFGNTLRDGTGLLNASDYPNSQDFNDISAAINHIVETRVLPKLREQAKVGVKISFTGCAEVADESADLHPLKVIPIQTEVQ